VFSRWRGAGAAAALATTLVLVGCGDGQAAPAAPGSCPAAPLSIVVSVSQWGDIVHDLAAACGDVKTIIHGTSLDPHDYEPKPADLAAFTDADLVVVNGLGYDAWATKAAKAAGSSPAVVDAGTVVGKTEGDNPHVWYGPEFVNEVADAVTAELEALLPGARAYFDEKSVAWHAKMRPYYDEVSHLRRDFTGVTYGATEPVFDYMAQAIGLINDTPSGYERAAANEADPAPGDIHDFLTAIERSTIDLLVVNTQTSGALVDQLRHAAQSSGVPIVEVTEAPPNDASFESWQLAQLHALAAAIDRVHR